MANNEGTFKMLKCDLIGLSYFIFLLQYCRKICALPVRQEKRIHSIRKVNKAKKNQTNEKYIKTIWNTEAIHSFYVTFAD